MSKKSQKKNEAKGINIGKFLIIIAVIIIAIIIIGKVRDTINKNKVSIKQININDVQYYTFYEDGKYGVIDKSGNQIIENKYDKIDIPDPTKDIFIVKENENYKAFNSKNAQVFTSYENIEAIPINSLLSNIPYEKEVLKYEENSKWGIIDLNGNKITDPEYEDISAMDYKQGLLKVTQNGKVGVININGKQIIKNNYTDILSDGFYSDNTKYENTGYILKITTDDGYRYGWADKNGNVLVEPTYVELNRITDYIQDDGNKDIYLIGSINDRYGLIKNGKLEVDTIYQDMVYDSENNFLVVEKDNNYGIIKMDGSIAIPLEYSYIAVGGDYVNSIKDNQKYILNTKGEILNTKFTSHIKANDNVYIVTDNDNNYNLVNGTDENTLLKNNYLYLEYFNDNLFIATQDYKSGIITQNDEVKVNLEYDTIQKIDGTNVLEAVKNDTGKIDLIDKSGNLIQGLDNAKIYVGENYIEIKNNTDVKYFTLDGKESKYQDLFPNNKLYAFKQNEKWGLKDKNGETVVNPVYDMVCEQNLDGFFAVELNGKWGSLDENGKVIIDPTYKIDDGIDVEFIGKYYYAKSNSSEKNVQVYIGKTQDNTDETN